MFLQNSSVETPSLNLVLLRDEGGVQEVFQFVRKSLQDEIGDLKKMGEERCCEVMMKM